MPATGYELLRLVHDLFDNPGHRQSFNRDPAQFVSRYNLSPFKRSAFFTMDPEKIGEEIVSELTSMDWTFLQPEFPPCRFPVPDGPQNEYPAPFPEVYSIDPVTMNLDATNTATLSIFGQSFSPEVWVALVDPNTGASLAAGKATVSGTFRCSIAEVDVRPATSGTYAIRLINSPGTPHEHHAIVPPAIVLNVR